MNDALLLSLFGVCLVLSSFFSGSETALTTLSEAAVFRLKEKRHPQAARLERLRERLPQTISTLLIGNNLVNIAAGSIGTVLAIGALGPRWGVVAATAVNSAAVPRSGSLKISSTGNPTTVAKYLTITKVSMLRSRRHRMSGLTSAPPPSSRM